MQPLADLWPLRLYTPTPWANTSLNCPYPFNGLLGKFAICAIVKLIVLISDNRHHCLNFISSHNCLPGGHALPQDIYVVHCWLINPNKLNLLSWLFSLFIWQIKCMAPNFNTNSEKSISFLNADRRMTKNYWGARDSLEKCVMNNYIHIFITIINKDMMLRELK